MIEVKKLKQKIAEQEQFIENLILELTEAYNSVELIKDEVISITQDFKHLIEALKK